MDKSEIFDLNNYDLCLVLGVELLAIQVFKYISNFLPVKGIYRKQHKNDVDSFFQNMFKSSFIKMPASELLRTLEGEVYNYKGQKKILILSVTNSLIFPPYLVDNKKVVIINLHTALLPFHKGIFPQNHAIAEGDEYSGVSWHIVSNEVDCGELLARKVVGIDIEDTGTTLLQKQKKEALLLFKKMFGENVLTPEQQSELIEDVSRFSYNTAFHSIKDLPGNGLINNFDSCFKVCKLLQAYDYEGLQNFKPLKVSYNDKLYLVGKYQIEHIEQIKSSSNPLQSITLEDNVLIVHYQNVIIKIEVAV